MIFSTRKNWTRIIDHKKRFCWTIWGSNFFHGMKKCNLTSKMKVRKIVSINGAEYVIFLLNLRTLMFLIIEVPLMFQVMFSFKNTYLTSSQLPYHWFPKPLDNFCFFKKVLVCWEFSELILSLSPVTYNKTSNQMWNPIKKCLHMIKKKY